LRRNGPWTHCHATPRFNAPCWLSDDALDHTERMKMRVSLAFASLAVDAATGIARNDRTQQCKGLPVLYERLFA